MSKFSYYKGYRDPHKSLAPLSQAARSLPGARVMKVPMHVPKCVSFLNRYSPVILFFKFYAHLLLPYRISKDASPLIIVREFLTLPLLFVSPFLFCYRKRIYLLCIHNIAWAVHKFSHKITLKILSRIGFRFLMFDDILAWDVIDKNNKSRQFIKSVPFPVLVHNSIKYDTGQSNKLLTIGFVGHYREEKSFPWAIEQTLSAMKEGKPLQNFSILIGSSDSDFLSHFSDSVHTINTRLFDDYIAALCNCDILVLPYEKEFYSYRSTGILAEAVGCGCAIVAPDLPVLRDQVHIPSPVGATYSSRVGLVPAILSAAELLTTGNYAAAQLLHLQYRSTSGLRTALMELLNAT